MSFIINRMAMVLGCMAISPLMAGCTSPVGAPSQAVAQVAIEARPIQARPGMWLDMEVADEPDLYGRYAIGADGAANLPLVGKISLLGKTEDEVKAAITAAYAAGYLKAPQIKAVLVSAATNSRTDTYAPLSATHILRGGKVMQAAPGVTLQAGDAIKTGGTAGQP